MPKSKAPALADEDDKQQTAAAAAADIAADSSADPLLSPAVPSPPPSQHHRVLRREMKTSLWKSLSLSRRNQEDTSESGSNGDGKVIRMNLDDQMVLPEYYTLSTVKVGS